MYERELEQALAAARTAGKYLEDEYARFKAVAGAPADITTEADRRSQEIILKHLTAQFSHDAFCAEEKTETLAGKPDTGDRLWIIDPIDGTRGFVTKNGEFSVMIGFVDHGDIAVGVVLQPATGRLTYARRGQGCWRQDGNGEPTRCNVSTRAPLAEATMIQSHTAPGKKSRTIEVLGPGRVIESYSAGVKLAVVARGEADLYLNTYEEFHDWDICAGHILVTEAGGQVTGLCGETLRYGSPGAWQRSGLIASNGRVHEEGVNKWVRSKNK